MVPPTPPEVTDSLPEEQQASTTAQRQQRTLGQSLDGRKDLPDADACWTRLESSGRGCPKPRCPCSRRRSHARHGGACTAQERRHRPKSSQGQCRRAFGRRSAWPKQWAAHREAVRPARPTWATHFRCTFWYSLRGHYSRHLSRETNKKDNTSIPLLFFISFYGTVG